MHHAADVCLDDTDKAKWLEWTKMNVMRHWDGDEGPIKTSDVIVIDDPQGRKRAHPQLQLD